VNLVEAVLCNGKKKSVDKKLLRDRCLLGPVALFSQSDSSVHSDERNPSLYHEDVANLLCNDLLHEFSF
jgi:hypothetical protein